MTNSENLPVDIRVCSALERIGLSIENEHVREWMKAVSLFGDTHPAALGCLLQLVRYAWGDPYLHIMPCWRGDYEVPRSWSVWSCDYQVSDAPSEAEGLVAALIAAPGVREAEAVDHGAEP